jgi:4-carboxymuconolactone decarboxylase
MDKRKVGKQRLKEIFGEHAEDVINLCKSISPDFANYIVDFAYGDLYTRKGFSDKSRELAAVACLIGQGNTGLPLKAHLKGMLNVGWKKEEIIELLIFLVGYVGFPSCVDSIVILRHILAEKRRK